MKPIEKLNKLSAYLIGLNIGPLKSVFTTNAHDATARLNGASGKQIVSSRPELHHTDYKDSLSAVIFVLDKSLGNGSTPEKESRQYDELLNFAGEILTDITVAIDGGCQLGRLAGLSMVSYDIVPETSIFGGWLGWSIEIEFE